MLGLMAKGFFTDSPLIFFPVLALVLFMITFTFITIRTLRSSNESIQRAAALPLEEAPIETTREKDHDHE